MAGFKRPADLELGGRARKLLREVRPCQVLYIAVDVVGVAIVEIFDCLSVAV